MSPVVRRQMAILIAALGACLLCGAVARAEEGQGPPIVEAPGWELTTRAVPTNFAPGGRGTIVVDVFNVGAAASHGEVTVTDTLPSGFTAREAGELKSAGSGLAPVLGHARWDCFGNGLDGTVAGATIVTCTNDPQGQPEFDGGGGAPSTNEEHPIVVPPIGIAVNASATPSAEDNHAVIGGGGAPATAATTEAITVSAAQPPFGLASADAWLSNADGTIDTQAGSHPYEATFSLVFNAALGADGELHPVGGEPRHLEVQLPPGIIADATAVPQCTRAQLAIEHCPQASIVGTNSAYFTSGIAKGAPIFNMVPPPGVAVQFGFNFGGILALLNSTVRTGSDYGATTTAQLPQRELANDVVTLWDVPGEASHNPWRNGELGGCSGEQIERAGSSEEGITQLCVAPSLPIRKPILTVPTSCGEEEPLLIRADDWQTSSTTEARFMLHDSHGAPMQFSGCEELGFQPLISASADSGEADSPTGATVEVKPSLGGLQERGLRSTSAIKHVVVTLPEGFVANPGRADGLQACQETREQSAIGTEDPAACPPASRLGSARIKTPLLEASEEKELEGTVYLLQSNPPELHLLVAADADGVNLKLVGIAHLNEATGQIEAVFGENPSAEAADPALRGHLSLPPVPFSSFKLSLDGGAQSALVTPNHCGVYSTDATFTPWASPFVGELQTGAAVGISAGADGGSCPASTLPFAPSMTAGTTSTDAGAYTNFQLQLQRGDGQQRVERFQFTAPEGLSAVTATVPLCPEAQANAGTCAGSSQIGHAFVAAGPGNNPLILPQPGAPEFPIYLTGPYHGAPFGLSIVSPIVAGPFNLGTIVTRARIDVDPVTTQVTVTTDPLPQIVKGVPTDLRLIGSVIDRPSFFLNPTSCTAKSFSGSATSASGAATAPLASNFAVGACSALKFTPTFSASTSAKTSKAEGARFHVKVAYPSAIGTEANITKVDLTIPSILPTRLTTIQKACTAARFDLNPAGCPEASRIATAVVHTPVLKSPLSGPAYFVSHGSAAFPDVEIVLQGEGITLVLDGKTQIKKGVTFSHFETVPDQPFSSFEFTAPRGPYSIFTANGNLCTHEIKAPTTMTAQNGAVLTQDTAVAVEGCPNTIKLLSRRVHGRTLRLTVGVPSAGRLRGGGKGLSKVTTMSKGRGTVVVAFKAKSRRGTLKTKVHLSFTPQKGHTLTATVSVKVKV